MKILGVREVYKYKATGVELLRLVTRDKIYANCRKNEGAMIVGYTDYVEFNVWGIQIYLRAVENNLKKYFGSPNQL